MKPNWVCYWGLLKVVSYPPTDPGKQEPYIQVLAETVNSLGSLEIFSVRHFKGG